MPQRTEQFMFNVDLEALDENRQPIDAVFGLSDGAPSSFSALGPIARFNPEAASTSATAMSIPQTLRFRTSRWTRTRIRSTTTTSGWTSIYRRGTTRPGDRARRRRGRDREQLCVPDRAERAVADRSRRNVSRLAQRRGVLLRGAILTAGLRAVLGRDRLCRPGVPGAHRLVLHRVHCHAHRRSDRRRRRPVAGRAVGVQRSLGRCQQPNTFEACYLCSRPVSGRATSKRR
jgi:hypothetical protein